MSKSRHHEGDQPLSTTINEKKASAIIPRQLTKVVPSGKDIKTLFTFIRLLFSLNYTKIDILLLVVGTFFAIAAGVPEPLLGIVLGQLINELNTVSCSVAEYDASSVRTKVLYLIYITIFNFFSIYIYAACWGLFSERLARRYRKTYFRSVIRQEAAFHDSLSSGDIMSRLVNDIETVQSGTSEKLGIYIATLSYFVTAYIVAFIKVPLIAGILIAIVPCFFAMSLVGGYFASKFGSRVGKHVENATSIASSSLSHLKIVHAFNAHERLEESFSAHLSRAQKDALKKAVVHATQMGTLFFIAYSSNALAYWKGAHLIADSVEGKNSGVSVGAVYTIIFILIDASFILSQVSPYIHVFSAAASASKRLLEVINRSSEIDGTSEQGEKNAVFGNGDIIFQDVHFTYPSRPQNPILGGVSFRIPAKKHTAIVGPSGGGKSTIVALLERFYDPTSGDIYTGSESFRSLNVSYLRGQMGFVQQEPLLLDRSVLENIAYGLVGSSHHQHLASAILGMRIAEFAKQIQSGSSEEEMLASCDSDVVEIIRRAKDAASQANALSFIEALPFGIATRVGPSGSQLSGGQKQRIALASALVREPKLLILDEATAALDSTSEKLIQEALLKVSETITTVSIAHRLATAKDAHQVVVIQKGQVVEHGSPRDLLDQDGVYAHMVGLQKLDNEGTDREEKVSGDEFEIISTADDKSLIQEAARDEKQKDLYPIDESKDEKPPGTTTLSAQENKIPPRMKWLTTKVAFAFIRPNILLVVLGLAMSVIIGASYSSNAVLFGYTVAGLSTCKSAMSIRDSGDLFGLLFFIVGVVEFFANVIGGYAFGWAADQMLYRIRTVSFRSLLSQSITWHSTNGRSPGILLSYITSDASAISGITGSTIGLLLATTVNLFAGIIISFAFAWKIAIVLVPTIPILLFAGVMKLRVQSQFAERHKKAFSQATEITMEALDNVRVVSSFSLEKQLYQEYLHSLRAPYQEILKAVTVGNFWLALAFSISHLISALAYWWGSRQIASGLYTQTQFFIVLPALLFSTQSCGQMLALAPDISKAGNAASHIATLVNTNSVEGEIDSDAEDAQLTVPIKPGFDLEASKGSDSSPNKELYSPMGVELQKVHFSYPNRSKFPILNGLSLKIEPGRFYALVGPSGCGKSTTFAMLERFYYPSSGSVIIDGQDITRISSASFRDEIALVPQENILFEGTVSFNIGLGTRPGYTPKQAEIEEACKLSNIHDVIMELPQGYETICSHGGKQFSGGQRQRLSIARALVRKPRLLLLDESTSALDVDSERKIQEAIANLGGNTTIIAIAHRLSTIYRADQIFLIEEGQCVDQGTHLELLDRSKTYQDSVLHQSFES